MKDDLFRELEASVREGGAILRGERTPSRAFVMEDPDVKGLRDSFRLSQVDFAALLGISVKTLRNWEQGRRRPEGPARVLLRVAAKHPEAIRDAIRPGISDRGTSAMTRRSSDAASPRVINLSKPHPSSNSTRLGAALLDKALSGPEICSATRPMISAKSASLLAKCR